MQVADLVGEKDVSVEPAIHGRHEAQFYAGKHGLLESRRAIFRLPPLQGEPTVKRPVIHEAERDRGSVIEGAYHLVDEMIILGLIKAEALSVPMK